MSRIRVLVTWFTEQLESMSSRDRNIATGLIAFAAVAMVGLITWQLQSVIADKASRVILTKQNLVVAQDLAQEYGDLQQRISDAEQRMGEFNPDSMNTYLETWAAAAGITGNLKSIQARDSETVGAFVERDFRVEVERAELGDVLRFLHAIETSDYPIKVRTALFQVKEYKRERTINVDLDIETFSKEEG